MRCGHTVSAGRWQRCIDAALLFKEYFAIIVVDIVAAQVLGLLYRGITVKPHFHKEQ